MEKRVEELERQLLELQTGVNKKKEKKTRPPTEYNIFMRQFIIEQKNKLGEKHDHKEAFKLGAAAWKKSTEKP